MTGRMLLWMTVWKCLAVEVRAGRVKTFVSDVGDGSLASYTFIQASPVLGAQDTGWSFSVS